MSGKISFLQLSFVLIMSVALSNHVVLVPVLLEKSGRDAWIAAATAFPLGILLILIVYYFIKKTKQASIFQWLQQNYGSAAAWIFRLPLLLYIFMVAFITMMDMTVWTNSTYLPSTPLSVITIVLLGTCAFCAQYGIRVLAFTTGVLLPFVMLLGEFVAISNFPNKDYAMLFPLFEHGAMPVINGTICALGGLAELSMLLLQQHVHTRIRAWHLILLTLLIAILTVGPISGALAEFGPTEAANQRYPAFEEWRLVKIGDYIEHVDFFSIYQWIAGAFIRISLALYLIAEMAVGENSSKRKKLYFLLGTATLLTILNMIPFSDVLFFKLLKKYYFQGTLLIVGLVLFSLLALVLIKRPKSQAGGETN